MKSFKLKLEMSQYRDRLAERAYTNLNSVARSRKRALEKEGGVAKVICQSFFNFFYKSLFFEILFLKNVKKLQE